MRSLVSRMIVVALAITVALPSLAHAETVAQLKSRLEKLKGQSAKAGKEFSAAYWKLDETEVRLSKTKTRLANTEKRLAEAKKKLNGRANNIYRRNEEGYIELFLGVQTFEQMVTRLEYLERIGDADAEAVAEVKGLRARLVAQQRRLKTESRTQAADLKRLKARRDKLQRQLKAREAEFRSVKRQLDAARNPGRLVSEGRSMPGPNGMVFPVSGSYYYADTWGASRGGGRRRHKGTDIMAPHGTPCVAITSGTVSSKEGGIGGKVIYLHGDNGWTFYYAHLQGWAVRSGRVEAGQLIGYVGSTGNATASAPHLHFEIHPGGGSAVNPYPYLRAME